MLLAIRTSTKHSRVSPTTNAANQRRTCNKRFLMTGDAVEKGMVDIRRLIRRMAWLDRLSGSHLSVHLSLYVLVWATLPELN